MENVRFAHQIRRQMVLIQHIMFGQNGKNGDPSPASIEEKRARNTSLEVPRVEDCRSVLPGSNHLTNGKL